MYHIPPLKLNQMMINSYYFQTLCSTAILHREKSVLKHYSEVVDEAPSDIAGVTITLYNFHFLAYILLIRPLGMQVLGRLVVLVDDIIHLDKSSLIHGRKTDDTKDIQRDNQHHYQNHLSCSCYQYGSAYHDDNHGNSITPRYVFVLFIKLNT